MKIEFELNIIFNAQHAGHARLVQAKVFKGKVGVVPQMFQDAKNVVLMFFCLGALRTVAAILYLQLVKAQVLGKLVQLRRVGVGNVKP